MKNWLYLILTAVLGLSACKWGDGDTSRPKPDINTDTLAFTIKTINERASDCGSKPDSACTVVKISYPVFAGQKALNDSVVHRLINLFMSEKPNYDLTAYVKQFMAGYYSFKKDDPRAEMFFTLDSHAKIIRQDSSLTTLEIGGYVFQGGAHGGSITTFINWNTKAGREIKLSDVMISGYREKLTAIADTIFRQEEKLTANASLANDYFFKDDRFALNENFLITPVGLRFLYNQYEIKPYAAGQTELAIPYSKIKALLKPNTVITQYLK